MMESEVFIYFKSIQPSVAIGFSKAKLAKATAPTPAIVAPVDKYSKPLSTQVFSLAASFSACADVSDMMRGS